MFPCHALTTLWPTSKSCILIALLQYVCVCVCSRRGIRSHDHEWLRRAFDFKFIVLFSLKRDHINVRVLRPPIASVGRSIRFKTNTPILDSNGFIYFHGAQRRRRFIRCSDIYTLIDVYWTKIIIPSSFKKTVGTLLHGIHRSNHNRL